ncbi:STAS domain-containing protein [Methylobacillus arboreus]|uniref:STAS domain-containing protein n=1 Tax=Methylobacillus arboreus TaxID=755170 RepID=UPI001E56AD30|nr:STAS domain-containing protein [Methylobacillus arboreus]MCB5190269.1 STAS domain-containing protein [Methylobacillus arboreus]
MAQIQQQGNRWLVSGDITVNQVDSLLAESKALPMSAALEIDLAQVAEVDTVALSLIFEWTRQAQAAKADINIVHLPANLSSLATLYGVLELIPQSSH